LFIALPTDLIDNPVFGRDVPVTSRARGALLVSSVLAGLVAATYVAVGCPVCNKLVVLALGSTGAIQYFAPIRPSLAVGAIALLGWAFVARVRRENSYRLPSQPKVFADV